MEDDRNASELLDLQQSLDEEKQEGERLRQKNHQLDEQIAVCLLCILL